MQEEVVSGLKRKKDQSVKERSLESYREQIQSITKSILDLAAC